MNKLAIPAILVATVMVAGIFAFMPVQQASTVHTTIQDTTANLLELTATGVTPATGATDTATWTINEPFRVVNIIATNEVDDGDNNDLGVSTVFTNLIISNWISEPDPPFATAVGNVRQLLDADSLDSDVANEALTIVGTTTLTVTLVDGANHAATDAWTITVLIEVIGSVTAPTAVLD